MLTSCHQKPIKNTPKLGSSPHIQSEMGNERFLYDMFSSRVRISSEREAVFDYDNRQRYSYGKMEQRANRLADYLTNELNIKKGDCISIVSSNSIAHLDAILAGYRTGIIVSSYNPMFCESDFSSIAHIEKPKAVLYEQCYEQKIIKFRSALDDCTFISLAGKSEDASIPCYEKIMALPCSAPVGHVELYPEDIQFYMHTGGTTGTPKTVMLSYRCIFYNILAETLGYGITMKDSAYVFLPFYHTTGINILMISLLMTGGRVIIKRKFDPKTVLEIIATERPTVGVAVPTVYRAMSEQPNFEQTDFSCYRWLLTGAAQPQHDIMEIYWNRGIKMFNNYGMTEIGPHNLSPSFEDLSIEEYRGHWSSVGKPNYFNQIRIVDSNGRDVRRGQAGELLFRGPLTFSGYLNNEEEMHKTVKGGWIHTGDVGYLDPEGYYHILDRLKNMYISGGENIYPQEIEHVLSAFPGIRDLCIVGVHDNRWGEVGLALINTTGSFKEKAFWEYVKENLPSIKRPKYLRIVDSIPKTSVGKTDLREVRRIVGH